MKRLAALVLFFFVANFVFAAVGPHCANGLLGATAQAAAMPEAGTHDHAGNNHDPSPEQDQGELCSSMQLTAALSGTAMPKPAQIETTPAWAVVAVYTAFVALLPAERTLSPPPPRLASDFAVVYARTGRLMI